MPNKCSVGRAKCVMEKHFSGFLDGGDPERDFVGAVPKEHCVSSVDQLMPHAESTRKCRSLI